MTGEELARRLASEGLTTEEIRVGVHQERATQVSVLIDLFCEWDDASQRNLAWCRGRLDLLRDLEAHLDTLAHDEEPEPDDTDLDPFPP